MNRIPTTRKPLIVGLATVLALSSGLASANHEGRWGTPDFQDRARVLSSTPVYEQISTPRRECHTEYRSYERQSYRNDNDTGNAVVGAIVGGLVGSTVGKGNGKVAAAAVGAATGAVIGDRWNDRRQRDSYSRPVEHCRVVDDYRQEIVGYDVTYRYQGKEFTTRLPYDPGEWVRVNVSVSVADSRPGWNDSYSRW